MLWKALFVSFSLKVFSALCGSHCWLNSSKRWPDRTAEKPDVYIPLEGYEGSEESNHPMRPQLISQFEATHAKPDFAGLDTFLEGHGSKEHDVDMGLSWPCFGFPSSFSSVHGTKWNVVLLLGMGRVGEGGCTIEILESKWAGCTMST